MSPRIAFWTSSFRPEIEAVASEVALLRRAFPRSVVWGVSQRDGFRLSWRKGFSVSPRFAVPFFLVSRLAQRAFQVNHLFGGLGDWLHLRALSNQPTILTLALQSSIHDHRLLQRVDRFVVEWPQAVEELVSLGVSRQQIRLIYPPVDTTRFNSTPAPVGPFTVLFASSPDRSDWLCARGVDLVLDVATLCPDMQFRLIWRPWGNSLAEVTRWIEERKLRNVEVLCGQVANMQECYTKAHVTVAPFRDPERCKPAPNSIVESLACGRPAIVTRQVGLADVIEEWGAGMITADDPADMAAKLRTLQASWPRFSANARALAVEHFAVSRFVESYREIYAELL